VSAQNSVVAGDLFVRTSGNLTLLHDVSTLGSDIDLVAGLLFLNTGNGALLPGGGGAWRVWAQTWSATQDRGGLVPATHLPNFYACAFDSCADPKIAGGNHFAYVDQPTVAVFPALAVREAGMPNPRFRLGSGIGLVNGDQLQDVVGITSESFFSPANAASPPGTYGVIPSGEFSSPVHYVVVPEGGSLVVVFHDQRPNNTPPAGPSAPWTPICATTGPIVNEKGSAGLSLIEREWYRVKAKPSFSTCVDLRGGSACSDF
jgi:hypothetical protein